MKEGVNSEAGKGIKGPTNRALKGDPKAVQEDKGKKKLGKGDKRVEKEEWQILRNTLTVECDITKGVQVRGWWKRMEVPSKMALRCSVMDAIMG